VSLNIETKWPCIRVCARRHVAAPDHPQAGRRFLPLVRGPVIIQGVPDPVGVWDPAGVRISVGGPEPPAVQAERLLLPGHVAPPDLSQAGNGSGTVAG